MAQRLTVGYYNVTAGAGGGPGGGVHHGVLGARPLDAARVDAPYCAQPHVDRGQPAGHHRHPGAGRHWTTPGIFSQP
eukprot:1407421-Pyramimonas_sp.AAC.2